MNGFIEVLETTRLTMSDDDLNKAWSLLNEERKVRRDRASSKNRYTLKAGDSVSFTNNRTNRTMTGEIVRVKTKKAIVRVAGGNWDVPLSMLSAV